MITCAFVPTVLYSALVSLSFLQEDTQYTLVFMHLERSVPRDLLQDAFSEPRLKLLPNMKDRALGIAEFTPTTPYIIEHYTQCTHHRQHHLLSLVLFHYYHESSS